VGLIPRRHLKSLKGFHYDRHNASRRSSGTVRSGNGDTNCLHAHAPTSNSPLWPGGALRFERTILTGRGPVSPQHLRLLRCIVRRSESRLLGVCRRSTLTCCRRTRFSASSVALALKREARIPRSSLNRSVIRMRSYAVRLLRLRRIEFSVHTGVASAVSGNKERTPPGRTKATSCASEFQRNQTRVRGQTGD
jgi:hypothetical protein